MRLAQRRGYRRKWIAACALSLVGFSGSSSSGQQNLLSIICAGAGLTHEILLSPDDDVPRYTSLQFAFATDDVVLFSVEENASSTAARALDTTLANAGIKRNERKDVDDSTDATCLDIDFVDGLSWPAPPERVYYVRGGIVELLDRPFCKSLVMWRYVMAAYNGTSCCADPR